MPTTYGCLTEFQPDSDSIKAYLERVTLYFTANAIPAAKQVPILLSSIGASTYSLLADLVAPQLPSEKSFAEISQVLRNHFEPTRAVIAERFYFHKRDQAAGESIAEFDAALRKLAIHCKFGKTLDEALRDRFVCGLQHAGIQRRLLSENELTLKLWKSPRGWRQLRKTPEPLNLLSPESERCPIILPSLPAIYRCGRNNHTAAD